MPDKPLKPLAESFALSLARGLTVRKAAAENGVPERTAKRWSASPRIKARVASIRAEATDRAVGILSDGAGKAAETLVAIMEDADAAYGIRLSAARAVLADLASLREHGELRDMIAEIEARMADRNPRDEPRVPIYNDG